MTSEFPSPVAEAKEGFVEEDFVEEVCLVALEVPVVVAAVRDDLDEPEAAIAPEGLSDTSCGTGASEALP